MLKIIHHWWLPLLSALTWWGMLVSLLTLWSLDGFINYSPSKKPYQSVMYISDVAATKYQPIFIACSAVQGTLFIFAVASEFHLRRVGRLRQHCHQWANWALGSSVLFAVVGQVGIFLVAVFDLNSYPTTHISMLVIFIVFIGISALLNVVSFAALDVAYIDMPEVKIGLWLKVVWFIVEVSLAIVFVGSQICFANVPAILEWVISFVYPFYGLIMVYDLWPANNKRRGHYPAYNPEYPLEKKISRRSVTASIALYSPTLLSSSGSSATQLLKDTEKTLQFPVTPLRKVTPAIGSISSGTTAVQINSNAVQVNSNAVQNSSNTVQNSSNAVQINSNIKINSLAQRTDESPSSLTYSPLHPPISLNAPNQRFSDIDFDFGVDLT